jgi:hypothetical protein
MKPPARLAALAALCLAVAGGRAEAQWAAVPESLQQLGIETWWDVVQFSPWSGSLGLTYDGQERRLTAPNATERSSTQLATESFTIRNDGIVVIDRRLMSASVALGMLFAQGKQDVGGLSTSDSARLDTYSITANFLPETAYPATIAAIRNQALNVLPSGTTTQTDYSGSSLQVFVRENNHLRDMEWLPYLSGSVRFAEQHERQVTNSGTQRFEQDDRRQAATVDFQNGGEHTDLTFTYQFVKLDNYAYTLGSYESQSVNLYHSLDFGPGFARRLDSRLTWYDRKGATPDSDQSTLDLNEFLTIDHNVYRSSTYTYLLTRQDAAFGVATTQSASAQVDQQVYNNLSVNGSVNGLRSTLPSGVITGWGLTGSFDYSRAVPWDGLLRLNGGAGYGRSATEVAGGAVPVVDEAYAVPANVGAGSAILLKARNIVASSIVVVVIKAGGVRLQAQEGLDYTLRIEGDRTSIVPSPASALMLPGDPLNVSYTYLIEPTSEYATQSRSLTMSLDWSWIGLSATHDEADQESLSGGSELLVDTRRDFVQAWVRGEWDNISARAAASVNEFDSTRLKYREERVDEYVTYVPVYGVALTFTGNQYRTNYQIPPQQTKGASYRFDLQWNTGGWQTSAYLARRTFDDAGQPRETIGEAGLRTRRNWTMLDFTFTLGAQRRERGAVSSENAYFHVGAIRRF